MSYFTLAALLHVCISHMYLCLFIYRGLAVTAIRNKKVSSSGYRKKSLEHSFSAPTDILETAVTSALFEDDDRSLFSEDEVRALEAIRQAKRSDIDLSAFLSPEHWSADGEIYS
jgi:hypothetical protein